MLESIALAGEDYAQEVEDFIVWLRRTEAQLQNMYMAKAA